MKHIGDKKFQEDVELLLANSKEIIKRISARIGVQIPIREIDHGKIEQNVEYTKAKTEEIEERIIAATGELFESEKDRESLHISIRVSCDFHKFLLDFGDAPPRDEAEYVAETIRSGLDWFFSLASTCHYLDDELVVWNFDRRAVSNFRDLRRACLTRFAGLCDPSAPIGVTLAALLAFIHLEFVFMAQTYPFFVHSYVKEDQWLINQA